ncbi:MAG: hypothetical protein H7641_10515 [Candidatus Heimdallarchaeota archaeon]|nr:hypothetical protein [Candidatus Heimdallarchaeota archaeon]MCK4877994.1 hypothetical protein [Candidatus Heimdallarchaeota archaeon]
MPSEYIMYISILLVGTLAIGGISATMVAINNTMEDRAIEVNLENILQSITEVIHDVKENGDNQVELGATDLNYINILSIPKEIHHEEYIIEVTSTDTYYSLKASLKEDPEFSISVSLLISPDIITISGFIDSTSNAPKVIYIFDGISSSIVLAN